MNAQCNIDGCEKKHVYAVSIDCADCARKVENALKEHKDVSEASYDFPKGRLTVHSRLSDEEIKNIARSAEDEIEFLDEKENGNRHVFSVSIDCADCARKVEDALNKHERIDSAIFDFQRGKLTVLSPLSDNEIKRIAKEAEDEIEFIDEKKVTRDNAIYRIAVSAVIFLIAEISGYGWIAILSWLLAGYDVILKALKNITKGKIFDENFLMAIATVGALFISAYDEAAGVMIFYQIGEYFQRKAVGASRASIGKLMDLSADTAEAERNGEFIRVPSEDVSIGETIRIRSGEKVPLDGTIISGSTHLDMKALTGESEPVWKGEGDKVLSGSINGEGTILVRTESSYSDSTASKIMKLVNESEGKKARSERFITRFSRYYTPFVCIAALLVAFIPPVFGIMELSDSLYRACMLLVISCPCALVLSVPLAYFASMGSFARHGILIKGDESIQNLASIDTIAMDKTGTLTEGRFSVRKVVSYGISEKELLSMAASLERSSSHPIASAIVESADENILPASNVKEIPGIGIEGIVNGKTVKVGNSRILSSIEETDEEGTVSYVAEDGKLLGYIVVRDEIKEDAPEAIEAMRKAGVRSIVMLSGDRVERVQKTAEELGLDKAIGGLLPDGKLEAFESLMQKGKITAYAGDGINDAPTLARADIGIAMGGVGSDAAIEAADAVIMNDDISRIPVAIRLAKKTEILVKENIGLSLVIKALVFILAIFGITNMWAAVFADTGVLILAVINSLRALFWKV